MKSLLALAIVWLSMAAFSCVLCQSGHWVTAAFLMFVLLAATTIKGE